MPSALLTEFSSEKRDFLVLTIYLPHTPNTQSRKIVLDARAKGIGSATDIKHHTSTDGNWLHQNISPNT